MRTRTLTFIFCALASGCKDRGPSDPTTRSVIAPASASPTAASTVKIADDPEAMAALASRKAIASFLKSPSQAKFSDQEVIEHEGTFVLSRATVDAPNAMGVVLRQTWCSIVKADEHGSLSWNRGMGAWECGDGGSDRSLLDHKSVSGWPRAGRDLARKILGNRRAEGVLSYADKMTTYSGFPSEVVVDSMDRLLMAKVSDVDLSTYVAAAFDVAAIDQDKEHTFHGAAFALARFHETRIANEDVLSALHLGPDELSVVPRLQRLSTDKLSAMIERGNFTEDDIFKAIMRGESNLGSLWSKSHPIAGSP